MMSKAHKSNNLKSHNPPKLSFYKAYTLFFIVGCEFFLQSNSPDILAFCGRNLKDSIQTGNFSVRGFLIREDSDNTSLV